jgi:hypothetical protein
MHILSRRTSIVLVSLLFFLSGATAKAQENPGLDVPVEVLPVPELPVSLTNTILSSTENGHVLKCQVSNNSNSRIVGLTYLLLVQDSGEKSQLIVTQSVSFKLAGGSSKDVTFKVPRNLKIKAGDQSVLLVQEVLGRKWLWAVLNSRQVLTGFAKDRTYLMPEVRRMLNQVDSTSRLTVN